MQYKLLREEVFVPGFGQAMGSSIGSGCVCFLAKKQRYANADGFEYRLVSSGFFVIDRRVPFTTEYPDVLFRLRNALTEKNETEIVDLLSTEVEADRETLSAALDRIRANVRNIHAPKVRDYLNIYRCVIANSRGELMVSSGYAFIADWYDFGQNSPTIHGVSRHLSDEYQKYWPRLMFPIQPPVSPVDGQTPLDFLGSYLNGAVFKAQCRLLDSPLLGRDMFIELYDAMDSILDFERSNEHGGPRCWICSRSIGKCYYSQYYEYCNEHANRIDWAHHRVDIQNSPSLARRIMKGKPYLYYWSLTAAESLVSTEEIKCGMRKREIRHYLESLSGELQEWRNNPSLDDRAQKLKNSLLLLERIDDVLFGIPPNGVNPPPEAPCCFTELVELMAYRRFAETVR